MLTNELSKEDVVKVREDYSEYIKITIDVAQKIIAIGGEYHADAEKILSEQYQSKKSDIWGGGYNLVSRKFETNAVVNLKPPLNDSTEILDPQARQSFLSIAREKLAGIEGLI